MALTRFQLNEDLNKKHNPQDKSRVEIYRSKYIVIDSAIHFDKRRKMELMEKAERESYTGQLE